MVNVEDYRNSVFRYALNLTNDWNCAEDLTQECLLRALKKQHQLENKSTALAWLVKIARNIWIDQARKRKILTQSLDEGLLIDSTWKFPANHDHITESTEEILKRMKQLPQRQREVLYLHAFEELSISEISDALQINRNAVKASLSFARKAMRQQSESGIRQ